MMKASRMFVLAALAAFCGSALQAAPRITAHRGESALRPENTMSAFRLAFENGVDGVECDIYATSDGTPVIIHDPNTGRVDGSGEGNGLNVTSSTLAQLQELEVGKFSPWTGTEYESEKIPTLAQYLELLSINNTTKCVIELKSGANSLIAKTAEAVRAQPLATSERVVFISFDANLISSIRSALPDYPAWLILPSGTYNGASLLSQIEACNATGIDVNCLATVPASAIAAVHRAGYTYSVWTCDAAADALNLAKKGVDDITTNKGGEMKAALAADYAETVNTAFDWTLKRIDEPDAYIQSGLIANFDGIRNNGLGNPHSYDTRTWKNLVSGNPDAKFYNGAAETENGYWNDAGNGFYFPNNVFARLVSGMSLGTYPTVQIAGDFTPAQSAGYKLFFHIANGDNLSLFVNNNGNSTTKKRLDLKADTYAGNRPTQGNWDFKTATFILGDDGKNYVFHGYEKANSVVRSKTVATPAERYSWGGMPSDSSRYITGTYNAVRIYNRNLSPDELEWNWLVDEARFRNKAYGCCVWVDSNVPGLEGAEAPGRYAVNGTYAFTAADATLASDNTVWEPAGYKLELWDAATETWNVAGEFAGARFEYVSSAASVPVRLTWNWRLKTGAHRIDARDYAAGGLAMHFDGIRNAGFDAAHDSAAAVWKNLADGNDAAHTVFDPGAGAGRWTANAYYFGGGELFATARPVSLKRQGFIQVAADYDESVQIAMYPVFTSRCSENKDGFGVYVNREEPVPRASFKCQAQLNLSVNSLFKPWDGRLLNAALDYDRQGFDAGAGMEWIESSFKAEIGSANYGIGSAHLSTQNRIERAMRGAVHAVRVYDRILTASEIKRNRTIDAARFFGVSAWTENEDIVEVRSSVSTATPDGCGCWILRGGAEKTFSAPATAVAGGKTYVCAGYRIETWNAEKRLWENPAETAGATSVVLTGGDGAANRRLTWLWTLSAGLRTAADYGVEDYVQNGLVAHYDAIANNGAGNGHAYKSLFMHDLSYRGVPLVSKVADATQLDNWTANARVFKAAETNCMETAGKIGLGNENTIQAAVSCTPQEQTANYPSYATFGYSDYSFFTRAKGNTVEAKYPEWINGTNPTLAGWEGKYINHILTPGSVYLFQGTEPGAAVARNVDAGFPETQFAFGGPASSVGYSQNNVAIRSLTGKLHSLRLYNRALSQAELEQNRKVDEIRFRDGFSAYRNLSVAAVLPFEGVEAPLSTPAGEYEVAGTVTLTAGNVVYGGSTFTPRYTVEALVDGTWSAPVETAGGTYEYTAGGNPVRITWKWADASAPVSATWTGEGAAGNLSDPDNWRCLNADGAEIPGAVPQNYTAVTIDGATNFTVPAGTAALPWGSIRFGDGAPKATQWGIILYNQYRTGQTNWNWLDTPLGAYKPKGAGTIADLDGFATVWAKTYLHWSQLRYDGWFYVSAAKAGEWTMTLHFDDHFAFAIDGDWVVKTNTHESQATSCANVSEGWHRFTIVCGDTYGNQGAKLDFDGGKAPFTISVNGAPAQRFDNSNFPSGTGGTTITLQDDCDWSALGTVTLPGGATVDLNGHNLTVASLSAGGYIGAVITNSSQSVVSDLVVKAGQGATATNDGVTIAGNVRVVKTGQGVYSVTKAEQTYTGGTLVSEGTVSLAVSGEMNPLGAARNLVKNGTFDEDTCAYGTVSGNYSADTYGGSSATDGTYANPYWTNTGYVCLTPINTAYISGSFGYAISRFTLILKGNQSSEIGIAQDVEIAKPGRYRLSFVYSGRRASNSTQYLNATSYVKLVKDGVVRDITSVKGETAATRRKTVYFDIEEAGVYTLKFTQHETADRSNAIDDVELVFCGENEHGGEVEVAEGAVLDLNGQTGLRFTTVVLNGGTLANTGADAAASTEQVAFIRLKGDSSVSAAAGIAAKARAEATAEIDLGGKTLTAEIGTGKSLYINNADIANGTFATAAGGTLVLGGASIRAENAAFDISSDLAVNAPVAAGDFTWRGASCSGTPAVSVYGTFTPVSQTFPNVQMQDGSVLDLSGVSGPWAANNTTTGRSCSFAAGAVVVNLAGRRDLKSIAVSASPYVVTWNSLPAGVDFALDAETQKRGYSLSVDAQGLALVPRASFSIRITDASQTIDIPVEWTHRHLGEDFDADGATVEALMKTTGQNGLPYWQSYCLGLVPGDASSVVLCEPADDADPVGEFRVKVKNLSVPERLSGVTVRAYLQRQSAEGKWNDIGSGMVVSGNAVLDGELAEGAATGFFRVRIGIE